MTTSEMNTAAADQDDHARNMGREAKQGRTPGPWVTWVAPDGKWYVKSVYRDDAGRRCTTWLALCDAVAQPNQGNADFIVRMENSFDGLLECHAILKELIEALPDPLYGREEGPLLIRARAALAKVGAL